MCLVGCYPTQLDSTHLKNDQEKEVVVDLSLFEPIAFINVLSIVLVIVAQWLVVQQKVGWCDAYGTLYIITSIVYRASRSLVIE